MTYGELKEKIRDLGFEENSTLIEYDSIVRNACNRAVQLMFDDIVLQLKNYYKQELSTDEEEWQAVRPPYLTVNSPDSEEIMLPDNLYELVPLLVSYFVWLDDDVEKATYYWNAYNQFRQTIISTCLVNTKAKITGGVGW